MHIVDIIFHWARMDPHRPAIILPEMVTTFAGLADGIESVSKRIDKLELNKDEPVAVALANPTLFITVVFALLRSGFTAAPAYRGLIPHLQPSSIKNLIYDTEGLVASGGRNIRFDPSWLPTGSPPVQARPRPVGDVRLIFFTSGTTGLPKKVVQAAAALDQLLQYPWSCAAGAHQKILIMPGLASTFGLNSACEVLYAGKTACFVPNAEAALSLIGIFGVEFILASPTQALELVESKKKDPAYETASLKEIRVAGGKVGPKGIADIRAVLCRNVVNQYGATEAGIIALGAFDRMAGTPGAVGFVMPWNHVQIVDDTGQPMPPSAEGSIRYRTPRLMENLKVAGSEGLAGVRDGWFYPGDVGRLTADGILCVSGRTTDVINIGGTKLSASRIEEIVASMPQVREAAACGVEDASGLEQVWIAAVANGPVAVEEIKRHLGEHKDVGVIPDQVFLIEEIPRGNLGKVQKAKLKEILVALKRKP